MSRPKKKSRLQLIRKGYWWCNGQWTEDPQGWACSARFFKNIYKLYRVFESTPGPCRAIVSYRSKGRWYIKFIGDKP